MENSTEIDFIAKDLVIEAKYNQELNEKQLKLLSSVKSKKKVIAKGDGFFLSP